MNLSVNVLFVSEDARMGRASLHAARHIAMVHEMLAHLALQCRAFLQKRKLEFIECRIVHRVVAFNSLLHLLAVRCAIGNQRRNIGQVVGGRFIGRWRNGPVRAGFSAGTA